MTDEMKALSTIEALDTGLIFTGDMDNVWSLIDQIKAAARSVVTDATTPAGRKEIITLAAKVTKAKTFLDGAGKDLTEEWANKKKVVDNRRKLFRDELDALKDEIRKPVTEFEEAEAKRIEDERLEAERVEKERVEALEAENKKLKDAEKERLDKEAADLKEKERLEREEKLKAEAADKARIDAEEKAERDKEEAAKAAQKAIDDAKAEADKRIEDARLESERKERERKDAEAKAKAEAEEAELARVLEAERIRNEEAIRIADAEHRAAIEKEVLSALVDAGFENATLILQAIADGQIKHVEIKY